MISTYQTSAFPPQPPPHLSSRTKPPALRRGPSRTTVRVLVVVAVLHLLLTFGGFFFLYADRMIPPPEPVKPNEQANFSARTSERRSEKASPRAIAGMTVKRPPLNATGKTLEYLQWNIDHSIQKNVGYYRESWLRVKQPGDYFVFAQVSFSGGGGPGRPLISVVKRKHDEAGQPRDEIKAYCSHNANPCTASQGQVLSLQVGNLLAVWVENHKWVDYEKGATTFGIIKL